MSQSSCCLPHCRGTGARDGEHPERASQSCVARAARSTQPAPCSEQKLPLPFLITIFHLASESRARVSAACAGLALYLTPARGRAVRAKGGGPGSRRLACETAPALRTNPEKP